MKNLAVLLGFFFLILFAGCKQVHESPVKKLFVQERCAECHVAPFNVGKKYGDDWHYANLWDPTLVSSEAKMPRYSTYYKLIKGTIAKETYDTPSGEKVYSLERTPELEKLFTFRRDLLIYLYPTAIPIKGFPLGLKAFSKEIVPLETPLDGIPVLWGARDVKFFLQPGMNITLITADATAHSLVSYVQSLPEYQRISWLENPPVETSHDKINGKNLYELNCATCHGERGDGGGSASVFLFPRPRNFLSGEYKFKTTVGSASPTDQDLYRTLTHGVPGTSMPPWNTFTPKDRWDLIAYIKTFSVTSKKARPVSYEEPPTEDANSIKRGEQLFFGKAQCNDCHGPGAKSVDHLPHGDGLSARVIVDDWGYPIAPRDLVNGEYKRGKSRTDIYLTITTGISGTPMASYAFNLTDDERWAIASYVHSLSLSK